MKQDKGKNGIIGVFIILSELADEYYSYKTILSYHGVSL
jgi:hypothetical protein